MVWAKPGGAGLQPKRARGNPHATAVLAWGLLGDDPCFSVRMRVSSHAEPRPPHAPADLGVVSLPVLPSLPKSST